MKTRRAPINDQKKTYAQLIRKLDKVFSLYIRERDTNTELKGQCCTCGAWRDLGHADCGHFISRGKHAVRYDEKNCALQCKRCNKYGSGEVLKFADYIENRWGEGTVDMLRMTANKGRMTKGILLHLLDVYNRKLVKIQSKKHTWTTAPGGEDWQRH
jgi:hypothetical protein